MDDRKKPLPPVPKFGCVAQQITTQQMETEIQNFFAEISQTIEPKKYIPQPIDLVKQVKKVQTPVDKLSQINSKLTDLLKKRDNKQQPIKPIATPQVIQSAQVPLKPMNWMGGSEEQRKLNYYTIRYDPARPNDYSELQKTDRTQIQPMETEKKIKTSTELKTSTERLDEPRLKSAEEKALKMMQKYGFRVGEGLGKNSQGMTTPLIAQKTSDNIGVIKASAIEMDRILTSRVLVMTNMVLPNQVDDDLESEIVQELSKYGVVKKVLIYLQPELEDDQAVRIFVEFEHTSDATIAMQAVDGRVFEKRIVVCRYYSEESYYKNILDNPI